MSDIPKDLPPASAPRFRRTDVIEVMRQIALHVELCTRAWIGLGEGRVLILKDDVKGLHTYYVYEDGVFTFYDRRGGSQVVRIEEITEIAGF